MSKRSFSFDSEIYKSATALQGAADNWENALIVHRDKQYQISAALYEQLSGTLSQAQALFELVKPRRTVELIGDVLIIVFSHLPVSAVRQARRVCKLWDRWASLFITRFCIPISHSDERIISFLLHAGRKFPNRKVLVVKYVTYERFNIFSYLHLFVKSDMIVDFTYTWIPRSPVQILVPMKNAVVKLNAVREQSLLFTEVRYVTCPNALLWGLLQLLVV
jgi:hypothetical protein